jgi:hypothetical protein
MIRARVPIDFSKVLIEVSMHEHASIARPRFLFVYSPAASECP